MASEILGLFNAQSPQDIRNKALDSMMISPTQMGSQGLLQQVVSMGQNAGTMLGMGAGSLLGGRVAGEVEAAYLDDAIKAGSAVKGTPVEKMQAVADALADKPGMGKQFMMAQREARRLQAEDLQMQKAQQDLQPEYKNIKVPVTTKELGADGQYHTVTKSVEFTHKWNPTTKQYEPFQGGQQGVPQPTAGNTGGDDVAAKAKAELEKARAAKAAAAGGYQPNSTAPKTIESMVAGAEEKAQMAPLIAEADVERAGYNSAERQMQEQEKRDRALVAVDNLLPESIKYFEDGDAERILRDYYAYLTDEQKIELRKRIARSKIGKQRVRPKTDAPKGDISGSRLF